MTVDFSPNFKGVYFDKSLMNKRQLYTAAGIYDKFQNFDYSNQKSRSYEVSYERRGIDFIISPSLLDDSVDLYASFNNIKDDKDKYLKVGTYNSAEEFDADKLENALHKNIEKPVLKLISCIATVTGIVVLMNAVSLIKIYYHRNTENIKKVLNIDTIKNIFNSEAKNTVKFVPKH